MEKGRIVFDMCDMRTKFNEYGMDSRIYDATVVEIAERLIREGMEPRKAYEQALEANV